MRNIIKIYIFAFVAFSLMACDKEKEVQTEDEVVEVDFTYTKSNDALDDNATIAISLFPYTSAYYGIYSLTANNDGYLTNLVPLSAASTSYTMAMASTGSDISSGDDYASILPVAIPNTSTSCYGYKILRDEANNLYVSNGVSLTVAGLLLNDKYSMDLTGVDDAVLKKKNSRIYFKIKSLTDTEEITGYNIERIEVKNLLNSIYYCPMHTYHYTDEPDIEEQSTVLVYNSSETFIVYEEEALSLAVSGGSEEYVEVISADYSEVYDSSTGESLYTTPILSVKLTSKTDAIEIPIKVNLEPQTQYTYTLTLASTMISVNVTAASWGDPNNFEGVVTDITEFSVNIGDDSSWDSPNDDDSEILGII